MQGMNERWQRRQQGLAAILEEFDATRWEFRVDLAIPRFFWIRPEDGQPGLVADTKVLCSYALSSDSIMMGWANRSLSPDATISPQPGFQDYLEDCEEKDAWEVAAALADSVGAEFLYRAPSPQVMVFLGLWNVRAAGLMDHFQPRDPSGYVNDLLTALVEETEGSRPTEELERLLRNQGKTLQHSAKFVHRDGPFAEPLIKTGEELIRLSSTRDREQLRLQLQRLKDSWK